MRPSTRSRADLLADLDRRLAQEPIDEQARGSAALQQLRDDERY
jgi:hypothetical protein